MQDNSVFHVAHIPVYGDTILSPMDGYSDRPFRGLVRRIGSSMSYTEFVNAKDVIIGHPKLEKRLHFEEWERPVVFQLYGEESDQILKAAQIVRERNPDIIDVNMGCPAKKISNRGAGAGLLRTPDKIAEIFQKLTKYLDVPITGKIRLGWDDESRNYLEVAKIVEDNGGQLLAVHGRTKEQRYRGEADWDAIAEIKQDLSIPVIGNGDVRRVEDIQRMKDHTGVDGVMIARAAIDNPWIFAGQNREEVTDEQVRETMVSHLTRNVDFYGPELGVVIFRKFANKYITPYRLDRDLRTQLLTSKSQEDFMVVLDQIIQVREIV